MIQLDRNTTNLIQQFAAASVTSKAALQSEWHVAKQLLQLHALLLVSSLERLALDLARNDTTGPLDVCFRDSLVLCLLYPAQTDTHHSHPKKSRLESIAGRDRCLFDGKRRDHKGCHPICPHGWTGQPARESTATIPGATPMSRRCKDLFACVFLFFCHTQNETHFFVCFQCRPSFFFSERNSTIFFPSLADFFFGTLTEFFCVDIVWVFCGGTCLHFGHRPFVIFFANNLSLCLLSNPTTKHFFSLLPIACVWMLATHRLSCVMDKHLAAYRLFFVMDKYPSASYLFCVEAKHLAVYRLSCICGHTSLVLCAFILC